MYFLDIVSPSDGISFQDAAIASHYATLSHFRCRFHY
jgi:hypothetical protein